MQKIKILKLAIFIAAVCGLGFFVHIGKVSAVTKYVDHSTGRDCFGNYNIIQRDCSGSDGDSYDTIQKALTAAQPADTVLVRAGEYREHDLTFTSNPTQESQRITLKAYNNEKAVLDPSQPTSELGLFAIADPTDCGLETNRQCDKNGESVYILKNGANKNLLSEEAYMILVQAPDYTWRVIPKLDQESGGNIWNWWINLSRHYKYGYETWNWWLGIDAVAYSDINGRLFVRYQNSDDVSAKTIKWAGNWKGFNIENKNYITIDGLTIRGCRIGINVFNSDYISVKNSTLEGGNSAIKITGDSDYNIYDRNIIHGAWLSDAYTPGSWEGTAVKYKPRDPSNPDAPLVPETGDACRYEDEYCGHGGIASDKINAAANAYQRLKYQLSDENPGDYDSFETRHGINFYSAGSGNIVSSNTAYNLNVHLFITSTSDTEVYGNTFYNSSTASISPTGNTNHAKIHDNLFYNNNYIIRKGYGYSYASGFEFFNNRSWNYPYTGKHFYYSQKNPIAVPRIWEDDRVYNNTFLGATALVGRSGCSDSSGSTLDSCDYLRNMLVVNNIIATPLVDVGPAWSSDEFRCGHNLIGGLGTINGTNYYVNACKSRSSNVKRDNEYIWNRNSLPSDWGVPNDSFGTVDIGLNMTNPFYIDNGVTPPSTSYSAITSPHEMIGTAYDAGAYEYGGLSLSSADINADGVVNMKDIQICIKAITAPTSIPSEQLLKCQEIALPDTVTNIKDIQEIIKAILNP